MSSFNASRLPYNWCLPPLKVSEHTSAHHQVILTTCIVNALLAPLTVAANASILAAIWRYPSLRTPSYVLLAGLAVTHFCTGLLTQPLIVVQNMAEITDNMVTYCIARPVFEFIAMYFSSWTAAVLTLIAVERWLHMNRSSLVKVRRIAALYITIAGLLFIFVAVRMYILYKNEKTFNTIFPIYYLSGAVCVVLTAFAYSKVFLIRRHHQNQVQTNQNAFDIDKYKKSMSTILYILAVFVFSYVPFLCCALIVHISSEYGSSYGTVMTAIMQVCVVVLYSLSSVNPLLYYWRIKEIRDTVKRIAKKALL